MKPLFDLEELKEAIRCRKIRFRIAEHRRDLLLRILGDEYEQTARKICQTLDRGDFAGQWAHEDYPSCADVYGVMADSEGGRSEEEYAWYIKIGVLPGESPDEAKYFLSFHPTQEMILQDGTCIRTTVEGYYDEE